MAISKLGTDANTSGNAMNSTLSVSHTLADGSNRKVLAFVMSENGSDQSVTGVTYGGVAMTKVIEANTAASGFRSHASMWFLDEASLPANGDQTCAATFSGTSSTPENQLMVAAYQGIAQGAPVSGDAHAATSTVAAITNTVNAVAATEWAFRCMQEGNSATQGFTHGQNQTQVWGFNDSSSYAAVTELQGGANDTSLTSTFGGTANRSAAVCGVWGPAGTTYTGDVSETVSESETTGAEVDASVSAGESVSVAESSAASSSRVVGVSEIYSLSDAASAYITIPTAISEAVATSEGTSTSGTFAAGLADSIAAAEARTTMFSPVVSVSESVGEAETISAGKVSTIGIDDTVDQQASASAAGIAVVGIPDGFASSDAIGSHATFTTAQSETVSESDQIDGSITARPSLAESSAAAEVVASSASYSVTTPESETVSESVTGSLLAVVGVSDSVASGENRSTGLLAIVGVSDAIGESDSLDTGGDVLLSEAVALAENLGVSMVILVGASDAVGSTESAVAAAVFSIGMIDTASEAEGLSPSTLASVGVSDPVDEQESVAGSALASVTLSDAIAEEEQAATDDEGVTLRETVQLSEAITVALRSLAYPSDALAISDAVSAVIGGQVVYTVPLCSLHGTADFGRILGTAGELTLTGLAGFQAIRGETAPICDPPVI